MNSTVDASSDIDKSSLDKWRQGDYTVDIKQFLVVDSVEDGELVPFGLDVPGFVVISQTCDIVNFGPGKEHVVVCPLREVTESFLKEIQSGRTPVAAKLQHPPKANLVIDLNRMMTVPKSVLSTLKREVGFSDDAERNRFGEALARKHGRFAFPDDFNDEVLGAIRSKMQKWHDRDSDNGKALRSIASIRATAAPDWDAKVVEVGFRAILHPQDRRLVSNEKINDVLKSLFDGVLWPAKYNRASPLFIMQTLADLSAQDYVDSMPIDWDYLSSSSR
ncbi:hypothetical protein LJR245_004521 [Rhizobium leguminosarum]|uniref:Uncharacterized protein n=2 Tax=Rhizobium TaxID=379 RepID=A0A179BT13_RHILE|nr:hypothetical protein [Rhizobium leguminosarum]OAP94827.1 hypothetical protein A4U53_19675 [Rhizobium leguminosarum]